MKIIVTHSSPDWDGIGSIWLLKKYLAGWQEACVKFVPAGERIKDQRSRQFGGQAKIKDQNGQGKENPAELIGEDEVIHVDTGLGALDHHQISDSNVCAMSLTWDFIQKEIEREGNKLTDEHKEAVSRIVKVITDIDHFREVFWKDAAADYHEFSLLGLMDGIKYLCPDKDDYYVEFGINCLNAIFVNFDNRIWAEKEIEKGRKFETRYGTGIGFETVNDTVLKLAQKMGYVLVVRKDPRKGYVRIKAMPSVTKSEELRVKSLLEKCHSERSRGISHHRHSKSAKWNEIPPRASLGRDDNIDLTLAYEQLKKIDPEATWFLHVSGKMLLNGTPKNPKMRPTKLGLSDIIKVLEKI